MKRTCPTCGSVRHGRWPRVRPDSPLWRAVIDFHWMARRYVDGRCSYASSLFNDHVRALLAHQVPLLATGDGTVWARDGMGRAYDGLTDAEAAQGDSPELLGRPAQAPAPYADRVAELEVLFAWHVGRLSDTAAMELLGLDRIDLDHLRGQVIRQAEDRWITHRTARSARDGDPAETSAGSEERS